MDAKFAKIFNHQDIKSFVASLGPLGARVSCAVTFPDGKIVTCGDAKLGIHAFNAQLRESRHSSMDWVITGDNLPKLKKPLGLFVKNSSVVKSEGAAIVKYFICNDAHYGTGECFLWEHAVSFDHLKHSQPVLDGLKLDHPTVHLAYMLLTGRIFKSEVWHQTS